MKPDDLPAHLLAPAAAERPAPALALAPVLLELQGVALREARFDAAATAVLAALARRLGCARVSLASRPTPLSPARLLATSEGVDHDGRLQAMRALCDAADEALEREAPVESPPRADAGDDAGAGPPAVALSALLRADEVRAALAVAFETAGASRAAVLYEMRLPPDAAARQLATDAALFVGPVLMLKARLDAPLAERVREGLRRRLDSDRRLPTPWLVGLVLGVALLAGLLWPSTHHVVAQARIEGHGQRVVPAPMDGFLQTVAVRPGEAVKAGQVLATLDDREAATAADKTTAERVQYERQYRDALTREDAAATEIARARFEQAKAQDDLAQSRVVRSRLVAPFDGVLISGDLASSIGSPVKRGQELMVVAPSHAWRVVAEVDEADVTAVVPGQKARVLLAALSGASTDFVVDRVSPVAQVVEGRNVFEAEGRIEADLAGLRPGLRGVVRIEAGERAPVAVWFERASTALRRLAWTLMA